MKIIISFLTEKLYEVYKTIAVTSQVVVDQEFFERSS